MSILRLMGGFVAVLSLSACMTVPATNIEQPMTARPAPLSTGPNNGAIYQQVAIRPLFEDRRARMVGDIITVNLVEKTSASKNSNASAGKSSTLSASIPNITGVPGKFLAGMGVDASGDNSFSGKGAAAAKNDFTGTITVTVVDVYPNGNLVVAGEKQVAINQGNEFIRFSGVVNPSNVTTANTVQSTQVADARIEYKATGYIDEAQTMGWMQRFFMNVLPF
ncbi:MAG: flagellar basal body L-ring protein FlgH [Rhodocyclaceae bacterium]|uniref:Flagellar L-ring protein n=1 Tax=Sphingomonas sp. A1 TaxID=90322 RepID=A0A0A8K7X6_9SPHN|nr:flagellar L-ring protein FlgH [Sphingomonas sp. A1]